MSIALAKYLVEQNLVSATQMDDVLQRQVLFGGSVDTNLLEMELLDEETLTRALGAVYQLPVASPELIEARDPRMPKLFPARLAQKYQLVPVSMSGRSLHIVAAARIHPLVLDEINFMLSLSVKTFLVCEARLKILLERWMGIESEPRYQVLADRLDGRTGERGDESGLAPEVLAAREALGSAPTLDLPKREERLEQTMRGLEREDLEQKARRASARQGRISFRQATDACQQATDRDELVDVILRFCRQFLKFVGLFVVHDEAIYGWDAVGTDDAFERIRRVRLPTRAPSVLATVVQTRAHYLGPVPQSGLNDELLQELGRTRPRNILIMPILVQERLIGLIYGDADARSIRGNRIQELLVFVSRLSDAFERLIHRMKSAQAKQAGAEVGAAKERSRQMAESAALRAAGLPTAEAAPPG